MDPGTTYLVRQPTAHPIHENWRVELFRQLLMLPTLGPDQLRLLGEIMYQVIYSFLVSETHLVQLHGRSEASEKLLQLVWL